MMRSKRTLNTYLFLSKMIYDNGTIGIYLSNNKTSKNYPIDGKRDDAFPEHLTSDHRIIFIHRFLIQSQRYSTSENFVDDLCPTADIAKVVMTTP